jgi:hypothetical protein
LLLAALLLAALLLAALLLTTLLLSAFRHEAPLRSVVVRIFVYPIPIPGSCGK